MIKFLEAYFFILLLKIIGRLSYWLKESTYNEAEKPVLLFFLVRLLDSYQQDLLVQKLTVGVYVRVPVKPWPFPL